MTFDEMRSMYLMNGEQNCSAEVCPSEYLEILHVVWNYTYRGYEGHASMIRVTIIRIDSFSVAKMCFMAWGLKANYE